MGQAQLFPDHYFRPPKKPPVHPPCRNPACADRRTRWRKRQLCWRCYRSPRIRRQFAPIGRWGEYGARPDDVRLYVPPPKNETDAAPGSAEKIAAMVARHERGEAVTHDGDTFDGTAFRSNLSRFVRFQAAITARPVEECG